MRRTIRPLLALFVLFISGTALLAVAPILFLGATCLCVNSQSTAEDESKHVTEPYAVYSAFLADEIERLDPQQKIHFFLKLRPIAIATDSEQARDLKRAFPPGLLREDTRANFIHVVAQKQTLKPLFQLPERARYSLDEQGQEPDPNVTGVHVSLSPIGFSEDGKQALLRADLHYYKCISSGYVLLEKKAGVWKVMQGIANGICL